MTDKSIVLPYGKKSLYAKLPDTAKITHLHVGLEKWHPEHSEAELVAAALENPIGSLRLSQLAQGKKKVVIISSDHTRPVPSRILMPALLKEIRMGNPDADITILIATGCHRKTSYEEMIEKYGESIVEKEHICVHDCDADDLVDYGLLPSGNPLLLNPLAASADLLVAEGFIEPHFFAGFSGGRKSVLPGICGRKTILYNHCAKNIADIHSVTGNLQNNPIHEDMVNASRKADLQFILNVVLGTKQDIIGAFAGDPEAAHQAGVEFEKKLCGCSALPADIVITSNGGYPLDQNIYQSVKGMSTAKQLCKKGGIIVLAAQCIDGHGGQYFYDTFSSCNSARQVSNDILSRTPEETEPDQWQSQIFADVLQWATVILVTEAPKTMVEALHMQWAPDLGTAISMALEISVEKNPSITCLPDAISAIIHPAS